MHSTLPKVDDISSKSRWLIPLFTCLGCILLWIGWTAFSQTYAPALIKQIYRGEASPEILNQLIRGQERKTVEVYLTWWTRKATAIGILWGLSLITVSIYAVPFARQYVKSALRACHWFLCRAIQILSGHSKVSTQDNPYAPMSRKRVFFVSAWCFVFIALQFRSVYCSYEWWPFTPAPMYSGRYKNVYERYEVWGVQDGRLIQVAGGLHRFSTQLRKLLRRPEQLEACLRELDREFDRDHPDKPKLQALQVRRLGWRMTPDGSDDDPPTSNSLVFEIRKDEHSATTAHTFNSSSARR